MEETGRTADPRTPEGGQVEQLLSILMEQDRQDSCSESRWRRICVAHLLITFLEEEVRTAAHHLPKGGQEGQLLITFLEEDRKDSCSSPYWSLTGRTAAHHLPGAG